MDFKFPLPEYIPYPNEKVYSVMLAQKFRFGEIKRTQYGSFVKYFMPLGWKFVDSSSGEDIMWEFVSPDNMVYFVVSGFWGSVYGNYLSIYDRKPSPYVNINERILE